MKKRLENGQDWISVSRGWIEISLVLALAFISSQAFWKAANAAQFSGLVWSDPVQDRLASGQAEKPISDFAVLATHNPFLSSGQVGASVEAVPIDAPETILNLKLKGVRAKGGGAGVAFIVLPDNRQVRASVGSEILDDVEVKYVFHDRVNLLTRGQLETLYLRDPEAVGIGLKAAPENEPAQRARVQVVEVSAQTFLQDVSFAVVYENGARAGFRLTPKTDASILTSAGLEPGDIVREINKRSASEMNGEDLQELLLRSNVIDLDVERDGSSKRISVRFGRG